MKVDLEFVKETLAEYLTEYGVPETEEEAMALARLAYARGYVTALQDQAEAA